MLSTLTYYQALARAIYSRQDVIILDDALRGLDADTENQLFHNLLGPSGLLRRHHATVLIASSAGKIIFRIVSKARN
jgi:ABC-type bacteriocin/lantibiotic exporter with double-glycine peptidase domain